MGSYTRLLLVSVKRDTCQMCLTSSRQPVIAGTPRRVVVPRYMWVRTCFHVCYTVHISYQPHLILQDESEFGCSGMYSRAEV